jgi:formylglycine-generating enzyme required for sulfatase activity
VTWTEALTFANLLSRREGFAECYVLDGCWGDLGAGLACDGVRSVDASVYDCPGYRLPTGAEWEYAARAGTRSTVYTGDVVERGPAYTCRDDPVLLPIAWYCANAGSYTHPVGLKRPNGWGLYDVIGNAQEWSGSDVTAYGRGPYVDWGAGLSLTGLLDLGARAMQTRGGGWNQWPNTLRASAKGGAPTWAKGPGLGFRLAQTLQHGGTAK